MSETYVVNIYKDFDYDVYIGRPGKGNSGYYGNPCHGSNRDQSIVQYKDYFYNRIKSDPEFRARIHKLQGKILGCFCKPKPCHGDVIVEYLNRLPDIQSINLAVVGSRDFTDYDYMKSILRWYDIKCIISGGARGADKLAERYAIDNGIKYKEFPADWDKYGKRAGPLRNQEIVNNSDEIVAFWDKSSPGTRNTINIAKQNGKPTYIYWRDENDFDDILMNW